MFVFTINFFLTSYGFGEARVIAPNVVEALRLAAGTEHGWMLTRPEVKVYSMERGASATCSHDGARMAWNTDKWECEECPATWAEGADYPERTATNAGFRAYCENLRTEYCEV